MIRETHFPQLSADVVPNLTRHILNSVKLAVSFSKLNFICNLSYIAYSTLEIAYGFLCGGDL
jgi:hypothetical protein